MTTDIFDCAYPEAWDLTQIAQIYLLQNNIEKAKEYLEKAIVIRENNYQTPYELWAKILEKEGNTTEAIQYYEKKIKAIEAIRLPYFHGKRSMKYYPIYAPKEEPPKYLYYEAYYRTKIIYLHDFYLKIVDLYKQM